MDQELQQTVKRLLKRAIIWGKQNANRYDPKSTHLNAFYEACDATVEQYMDIVEAVNAEIASETSNTQEPIAFRFVNPDKSSAGIPWADAPITPAALEWARSHQYLIEYAYPLKECKPTPIVLPVIDEKLNDDFGDWLKLIDWEDGSVHWTQIAVDFASMLQERSQQDT